MNELKKYTDLFGPVQSFDLYWHRYDDPTITICFRNDNQVKVRGKDANQLAIQIILEAEAAKQANNPTA